MITLKDIITQELQKNDNLLYTVDELLDLDLTQCRSQTICEILDVLEQIVYFHLEDIEQQYGKGI